MRVAARTGTAAKRRRILLENVQAYAFIFPAMLILVTFQMLPAVAALVMSTTKWGVIPERCLGGAVTFACAFQSFAGLSNYQTLLDPQGTRFAEFTNSLGVTLWYTLLTVPIEMAISLTVAYILFQKVLGQGAYRTIYFMPYITSTVAAAVVFEWILDGRFGVLNVVLGTVGIGGQDWLREPRGVFELIGSTVGLELTGLLAGPSLALVAVSAFTVWHFIGFQIVIFMAGLANISREYYEAARIDGASERQILLKITLPLLSPTTFFILIIATIGAMRSFSQIYVLTNGGPLDTTRTLAMLVFRTFFERTSANGIGLGAALSFIIVAVILAITFVQFRIIGRRVHYS